MRVTVDGKRFAIGARGFEFRGVCYGTFEPRATDAAPFPERGRAKLDFAEMRERGFTVVRTYTPPPDNLVELAADSDLHLLAGVFYPDWRYLVGASRRQQRATVKEAGAYVRQTARRLAGSEEVLALAVGNEVPADVVRWVGARRIERAIAELADQARAVDDELLVTYANYPTAEYLHLDDLDFLTFNVFLEREVDLRRYLTHLHHVAGERPLVLGELGLDSGGTPAGEARQAEAIDWQLRTALERGVAGTAVFSWTDEWWVGGAAVEGWHFGLTRADRSARPALEVAAAWNGRTVRDLDLSWPSISVVVCAYNAASTIEECLAHTCALEYPNLEVLVVDDGSTDATAQLAARHRRARVLRVPHAGLATARNAGIRAAGGDLVAFLDADAYPTPEWPWYLALGMDAPTVGGVGGPNVPPYSDSRSAQQVARSPGGPVHVLFSDDRAEHVPGCNMAFWKLALTEVGGFDPIYTAAGDDVDLCWKVLDAGWEIAFHPAALVWHHRRPGLRPYLRQQHGYGRAEALVEARHPDRFTSTGTARWRGHIYASKRAAIGRPRVYRGLYGTAAYQSVYRAPTHRFELAHQLGAPVAAVLSASAPLALLSPWLGLPALVGLGFLLGLLVADTVRADTPCALRDRRAAFKVGVAVHQILQPFTRTWGRLRHSPLARRGMPLPEPLRPPVNREGKVLVFPADAPRAEFATALIAALRRDGIRVLPASGWEDHDGRLLGSTTVVGQLLTSAHPEGCIQVRVRPRPRRRAILLAVAVGVLVWQFPVAAIALGAFGLAETVRGMWRVGPKVRRLIAGAES